MQKNVCSWLRWCVQTTQDITQYSKNRETQEYTKVCYVTRKERQRIHKFLVQKWFKDVNFKGRGRNCSIVMRKRNSEFVRLVMLDYDCVQWLVLVSHALHQRDVTADLVNFQENWKIIQLLVKHNDRLVFIKMRNILTIWATTSLLKRTRFHRFAQYTYNVNFISYFMRVRERERKVLSCQKEALKLKSLKSKVFRKILNLRRIR